MKEQRGNEKSFATAKGQDGVGGAYKAHLLYLKRKFFRLSERLAFSSLLVAFEDSDRLKVKLLGNVGHPMNW